MDVHTLNDEQFEELREDYYWQLVDTSDADNMGVTCPADIPDDIIISHYDGIVFVNDDFVCSAGM